MWADQGSTAPTTYFGDRESLPSAGGGQGWSGPPGSSASWPSLRRCGRGTPGRPLGAAPRGPARSRAAPARRPLRRARSRSLHLLLHPGDPLAALGERLLDGVLGLGEVAGDGVELPDEPTVGGRVERVEVVRVLHQRRASQGTGRSPPTSPSGATGCIRRGSSPGTGGGPPLEGSGPRAGGGAVVLRSDPADTGAPVAERGARATTAPDRSREPLGERAGLPDVLGGDPERVAVGRGRAVVAPAGPRRVADERLVAGEPVRRAEALRGDVDRSDTGARVEARVGGARVVAGADQREGDHAVAVGGDPDRRVGQVVVGDADVALLGDRAAHARPRHVRPDDEELHPGFVGAADVDGGVERAPDLAVGEHHLLHAGVVGVGDRKSTRLNSSHEWISYAVFCLKKKKKTKSAKTVRKKTKKNT